MENLKVLCYTIHSLLVLFPSANSEKQEIVGTLFSWCLLVIVYCFVSYIYRGISQLQTGVSLKDTKKMFSCGQKLLQNFNIHYHNNSPSALLCCISIYRSVTSASVLIHPLIATLNCQPFRSQRVAIASFILVVLRWYWV